MSPIPTLAVTPIEAVDGKARDASKAACSITVVIPVYNGEAFLAEAIESALHQTLSPAAIVVIDDGSTDATRAIACSFGDRVQLYETPRAGVSAARNCGVSLAQTEWVALLDHDDVWQPEHLETLAHQLDRRPDADVVYTAVQRLVKNPGVDVFVPADVVPAAPEDEMQRSLLERCPIQTSALMVRRTRLLDAGGFNPLLPNAQDWEMWIWLSKSGARFAAAPGATTLYRIHSGSGTHQPVRALGFYRTVVEQQSLPELPAWKRAAFRNRVLSRLEGEAAILMRELGLGGAAAMMVRSIVRWPTHEARRYKILLHMLLHGYPRR